MSNSQSQNILPKIQTTTKKENPSRNTNENNKKNKNFRLSNDISMKKSDDLIIKSLKQKNVKIIDEITKNSKRIKIIKKKVYKIIFVFRNEDFYITVKLNTLIKDMKKAICQLIGMNINKICLMYEDVDIDESNDEKTVDEYFDLKNIKFRPIIYIKKKFLLEAETSSYNLIPKSYIYKVKVINFPINQEIDLLSNENIDNVVNNFFKSYYSLNKTNNNLENNIYNYKIENILFDRNSEFLIEEEKKDPKESENPSYIVCFTSQDIAFDFNRYINALKLINPTFKEVKVNILPIPKKIIKIKGNNQNTVRSTIKYGVDYGLEEGDSLKKRNTKILKIIRNNYLQKEKLKKLKKNNSQSSITGIGPYLSLIDKERLAQKEDKKKWISPEGFISCVGKYSGIII